MKMFMTLSGNLPMVAFLLTLVPGYGDQSTLLLMLLGLVITTNVYMIRLSLVDQLRARGRAAVA